MAQLLTIVPGPVAPLQNLKHLLLTDALVSEPYATASGGVQVDLTPALLTAGKTVSLNNGIPPANVISVGGSTPTGYRLSGVLNQTNGANDGKVNIRLYNGTTEITDGNITQVLNLTVMVAV